MEHYLGLLMCALCWGFLLLGEYTVAFELVPKWFVTGGQMSKWGVFWLLLFQVFFVAALVSHLRAAFSQPGYTPQFPVPGDIPLQQIRYCEVCDQWKPDRTHHCRACKRCIHRMDHHCPWINNCVGAKTQKFFMCFLLYVFLCCLQVCGMMGYVVVCYFRLENRMFHGGLGSLIVGVLTGMTAVVFLVFTAVMLYDQVEVIVTNQTEVEKLSMRAGKQKTLMENMREALGQSVLVWFNPLVDSPEPDYAEVLYPTSTKEKHQ
jgi:hypothetical protein